MSQSQEKKRAHRSIPPVSYAFAAALSVSVFIVHQNAEATAPSTTDCTQKIRVQPEQNPVTESGVGSHATCNLALKIPVEHCVARRDTSNAFVVENRFKKGKKTEVLTTVSISGVDDRGYVYVTTERGCSTATKYSSPQVRDHILKRTVQSV